MHKAHTYQLAINTSDGHAITASAQSSLEGCFPVDTKLELGLSALSMKNLMAILV